MSDRPHRLMTPPVKVNLRDASKLTDNTGWTLGVYRLGGQHYLDAPVSSGFADGAYQFAVSGDLAQAYAANPYRRTVLHAAIWPALQSWPVRMANEPLEPVMAHIDAIATLSDDELTRFVDRHNLGYMVGLLDQRSQ